MILELVLPSFNMSEEILLMLSAGSGLIIIFTIFSFAADKGKKGLCIFGSIMTFILVALLMYLYISLKHVTSFSALNALLTVVKIVAGLSLIVELLVSLSLFFIFTRDSFFFNLFKCMAFVSSCVLTISVLYPLIMDKNYNGSLLNSKFSSIVAIVLSYSIVSSVITYIIAAPKEVDKTNDNYYVDVRNLTYNQTNVVDNTGVNAQPIQPGTVPVEPVQVVAPAPVAPPPVEAVPAADQPSIEQVFSAHMMDPNATQDTQAQQPVAAPQPVSQPAPVQPVQQPVATPQPVAQPAPVQPVQQPVAASQPVAQPAPVQPVQQPVATPQPVKEEQVETLDSGPATVVPTVKQ